MKEAFRKIAHDLPQSVTTALITSLLVATIVWAFEWTKGNIPLDQMAEIVKEYVSIEREALKDVLVARFGQTVTDEVFDELPPEGPFIGIDNSGNLMLYSDPNRKIPAILMQRNNAGVHY